MVSWATVDGLALGVTRIDLADVLLDHILQEEVYDSSEL